MTKSDRQLDDLVGRMTSLADRTRLRLLRLLERQELNVLELCNIVQLPQSTVSRHLKVLADQQFVQSRKSATTNLYRTTLDELDPSARKLWLAAREQLRDWPTLTQDDLRMMRVLREREIDSSAFFASAASQWDRIRRELYGDSFSIAALLALLPAELTVADLGCGTGSLIEQLSPHVKQVIGIDQSGPMLGAARKRLAGFENVTLHRARLENLPLSDGTCDAALLVLTLTYAVSPASVLKEAARILKPNGRLVIVDLLAHGREDFRRQHGQANTGFAPETILAMLNKAGLTGTARSIPPVAEAKGPALFLAVGQKSSDHDESPRVI